MNRNKNKYPQTYLIFPRICVWNFLPGNKIRHLSN
jgi:hypothetical protein